MCYSGGVTADFSDGAADALDRQITRAITDGYFEEAMRLAADSLALRTAAVNEEALRFRYLSNTLELTARIAYESGLALPAVFEEAAETYYGASISCLDAKDRLGHANQIVEVAEGLVLAQRNVESIIACRAAQSVFEEHSAHDQLSISLPGQVRAASVMCIAFYRQDDTESLTRQYQQRDHLIRKCAELNIEAPEDIITRLQKPDGLQGDPD